MRFYLADRQGRIVREREFQGMGFVPEFGIRYDKGTMLVVEYQRAASLPHTPRKLARYDTYLPTLAANFDATIVPIIVIDANLLPVWSAGMPYYFVTAEAFLRVPMGDQLTAPIYTWGVDGRQRPLREEGS